MTAGPDCTRQKDGKYEQTGKATKGKRRSRKKCFGGKNQFGKKIGSDEWVT